MLLTAAAKPHMLADTLEKVTECPYCASPRHTMLYANIKDRLQISADHWAWQQCSDCAAGFISPRMRQERLRDFYPADYSFEPEKEIEGNPAKKLLHWISARLFYLPIARKRAAIVLRMYRDQTGKEPRSLLEVGCGSGSSLSHYIRRGMQVSAVDFDERKVAYIKETLNIDIRCASAEALPDYPPQSFDIILASHLLEHMNDPLAVLKHWYRFVKPGGCVILALPMLDSINAGLLGRKWVCITEAPRHVTLPTHAGLKEIFKRAGCEEPSICGDNLLSNAGDIAISLIPSVTISRKVSASFASRASRLAFSMAVMLACLPLVWLSDMLHRPACVFTCARKPLK